MTTSGSAVNTSSQSVCMYSTTGIKQVNKSTVSNEPSVVGKNSSLPPLKIKFSDFILLIKFYVRLFVFLKVLRCQTLRLKKSSRKSIMALTWLTVKLTVSQPLSTLLVDKLGNCTCKK